MPFNETDFEPVQRYARDSSAHFRRGVDVITGQLVAAILFDDDYVMIDGVMPFTLIETVEEIRRLARGIEFLDRAAAIDSNLDAPTRTAMLNRMWFRPAA